MRLNFKLVGMLMIVSLLAGCASGAASPTRSATIPLEACQLAAPGLAMRRPAKCGTLTVYEDRAAQAGRQINLHIAVLPALSRTPAPDPLVFITGGPGGASTQDFLSVSAAFTLINQKRDIVLVDQRGTGQSNPLDCPPFDEQDADDAALQAWLADCLARLDADPKFYTTLAAVDDLDEVRAALGYDKINLYGISYGTRVAQTYMQRYPNRVRAVILDGVVPQDEALGTELSRDAQRALDLIFARCAANAECNAAFPNLPNVFAALLARVEQDAPTLTIAHPTTGRPTEVKLTRQTLATTMRFFSYAPETVALMPLLIYNAQTGGDLSALAAQSLIFSASLQANISEAMSYSVTCAEDAPFFHQAGTNLQAEKAGYLGEAFKELERICARWPVTPVAPEFKTLVRSDAPVLLLSGEADPVTPPANAEHIATALPNSLHLVAPGQGHGVILRGCIYRIAAEFIERGAVKGLDTACVNAIEPMPFFVSLTGPRP